LIIPRLFIIGPDDKALRRTCGRAMQKLDPGIYWYWPMIQAVDQVITTPQVVDLRPQSVVTQDCADCCISGAIRYRVRDQERALLKVQDYDRSLQTMALGIITRFCSTKKYVELYVNEIEQAVLKGIKLNARGWGLEILSVYVTDIGQCKNYRVLADRANIEFINDEDE